jgi:tetratricopeptide (TPR) repeat protein
MVNMVTKPLSDPTQKHVQLLKAALSLREGGEYTEALNLLEKAVQSKPDFLLAHIFLGLTYQAVDRQRDAEKAFRNALMIDPNSSEALQGLGLLLLSQNRPSEALGYLTRHLKIDPANAATLDVLIPVLNNARRYEEAENILVTAWEKTRDADIARRYARFLLSIQQVEKAQKFLEKAIEVSSTPHLLVELALTLVIEEKYPEAIDILQKALKIRPDYDRAIRGLAHCYTQINEGEKAIEMADRALAIDPHHYRNWQAKGDALLLQERFEEAAEAAQTGISLIKPEDAEAQPVLSALYIQKYHALLRMNDIAGALQTMDLARLALPVDGRFYLYPAQILIQISHPREAFQLIHGALGKGLLNATQNNGWLHALADLGMGQYSQENFETAKEVFENLVQIIPCESRFCTALGYILIGEGKLEQAEAYFKRELAAENGESKSILYNDLGYIHLLQNRLDEAEQDLKAALETDDVGAFLRVAFTHAGQIVPDYAPHPSRQTTSRLAAKASLTALALAKGDLPYAGALLEEMKSSALEDLLTLEVWGSVELAGGRPQKAREMWEQALHFAQDERERNMILGWLSTVLAGQA